MRFRSAPPARDARLARPATRALLALLVAGACDRAVGVRDDARTYEVAEATVHCAGAFEQECLRVRTPPDTAWTNFYAPIEGFAYEPGYRYVLRVAERPVPHPPVDALGVAYRLTAIVSKTRVGP